MNLLNERIADPLAEVHATKPREKEYKMVGRIRPVRGLKYWSIDAEGTIEQVMIDREASVDTKGEPVFEQKAHVDPRKRYCQALNRKNAARKFLAQGTGAASSDAESGGDTADGPTVVPTTDAPKPSNP